MNTLSLILPPLIILLFGCQKPIPEFSQTDIDEIPIRIENLTNTSIENIKHNTEGELVKRIGDNTNFMLKKHLIKNEN